MPRPASKIIPCSLPFGWLGRARRRLDAAGESHPSGKRRARRRVEPASTCRRLVSASGGILVLLLLSAPLAAQSGFGPQGVVRRFCELDGAGQRVSTATWPLFANLVEWPFEPVWDQVLLISGYEVGAPLAYDLDSMVVEVRYGVVGQISPNGHGDQAYVEKVPLRIRPDDAGNWRIMGPPPQPHVFVSGVDLSTARRALLPGQPRFPTNSDFVWQMFRASGWEVDYESTADVPHGNTFRLVTRPAPGDIVVYFRDGTPYHLGILEDEGAVISATVNAGVVRAPREAFAGDAAFYRLLEPAHGEAQEEASPSPSVSAPTPVQVASPRRRAALTPAAKPTPRAAAVARKPKPRSKPTPRHTAKSTRSSAKPPAKPSGKARPKAALKPTPKPTPAAKRR